MSKRKYDVSNRPTTKGQLRTYKLRQDLDTFLVEESKRTGRTMTIILERSLERLKNMEAPQRDAEMGAVLSGAAALRERFLERVRIPPNATGEECWGWGGLKNPKRYPSFDGQIASRVSYSLFNGEIPDGLFVLHKCDNPNCCNPKHLFLGTQADNMSDMAAKGRAHKPLTHCRRGHLLSGENIYAYPQKDGGTRRICKACRAMALKKQQTNQQH